MIVDRINKYLYDKDLTVSEAIRYEVEKLAGWSFKRQFMENSERDSTGKIYLSSVGKCPRQLAYGFHGIIENGREIDGRGRITFWFGDLIELMTVNLARLSGCQLVGTGLNQITASLKIDEFQAYGHPDGILIDGDMRLIEVKSMPSFSFDRFEKGTIDESYLFQVNAYLEALHLNQCVFVGINKNNSVMHEIVIDKDPKIVSAIYENVKTVINSTADALPESRFKANDKGAYPWNCLYCAWWKACHINAERKLVGKSYVLHEKKETKLAG
jgi:hypothetical protein